MPNGSDIEIKVRTPLNKASKQLNNWKKIEKKYIPKSVRVFLHEL